MHPIALNAPDLPVLFLSAIGRLVNPANPKLPYSQRAALVERVLRRSHIPLPAEIATPLAYELTDLADELKTMESLLEHFDTVEHKVRLTALGVETALKGQAVGQPVFAQGPVRITRGEYRA